MTTKTNIERLKGIEEKYKWGVRQSLACRNLSDSDIEWLIQLAKRVQDYEKALEFYADDDH